MMNGGNGGNGHSHGESAVVLTERLSPTYVPARDASAVVAPVLELEGLEPWAEIQGPALALEETGVEDDHVLTFDDPAQLAFEPLASDAADAPTFELEAAETGDGRAADVGEASEAVEADDPPPILDEAEVVEPETPLETDPIEIRYGEAHEAAQAGRTEDAKRLYRELLTLHPTHVRARNNLALILDAEGNHEGALAELDRALDIESENGTLLVNRGALLGAMGRYAAAERDLKKVLRVDPSHAEALFNLGVVMTKKGLWTEAVPHLKRAVELEPQRAAAHYYLGEALNHVDDLAGALAAYQRSTELQPSNPRALYGLGIIYDRLARPDDAAQMYRRSREVGRR
jgi:tetratricopeptide (TPR) repeat protein